MPLISLYIPWKHKKISGFLFSGGIERDQWYKINSFNFQILENCPRDLQADVSIHLHKQVLESNPAFKKLKMTSLRNISLHLSIIHLSPGDKIIYQGENIEALYFIENGSVEVKHGDALVGLIGEYLLTLSWRRSLSYRNQSINLQRKSTDWFLYDRDLRHERVKMNYMVRRNWSKNREI